MNATNALARVPFGRTGLTTTRLGLGTAPIGGLFEAVSAGQAEAVVGEAYRLGIRLFDTAPLYGFGLAEERVGRVLRAKPREDFVLTTKVGRLMRTEGERDPSNYVNGEPFYKGAPDVYPVFDFSATAIRASLSESLARLGLDRVDVAYLHDPDEHYDEARGDGLAALTRLRSDRVVTGIGAGMNRVSMLARFVQETDIDAILVAGRYSLLDRSAGQRLLPLCAARGVAVVVGGVFNSGVLADPAPGATYDYAPAPAAVLERVRALRDACATYDVPLRAAAIQFPFRHPAVTAVLVGARTVAEIRDAVEMAAVPIPAALWDDLDRI